MLGNSRMEDMKDSFENEFTVSLDLKGRRETRMNFEDVHY
jgi:hypothetical protein